MMQVVKNKWVVIVRYTCLFNVTNCYAQQKQANVDTSIIIAEMGDTLIFSKNDFAVVMNKHPELTNGDVQDPYMLYNCTNHDNNFNSEAGKDDYYVLYAYFLKPKNGIAKFAEQRKKLINIYESINRLFNDFVYGGTYFGHQTVRIAGYAEYSVYLYKLYENNFDKTYDISKQKELYIKLLRQLIEDEVCVDANTIRRRKNNAKTDVKQNSR